MTQLLAHRGASHLAPENTLEAFRLGRQLHADGFECDIQRCKTGEIVLFHDRTLERTTNFKGEEPQGIRDLAWADLKGLDAGGWKEAKFKGERIPLLKDLLEFLNRDEFLVIEVKLPLPISDGIEPVLKELLDRFQMKGRCVVGSFNPFFLNRFQRLTKTYPIALISRSKFSHRFFRKIWIPWLKPSYLLLEDYSGVEIEMKRAHAKNQKVFLWTLDQPEQIKAGIHKGANGIISNRPELFKALC